MSYLADDPPQTRNAPFCPMDLLYPAQGDSNLSVTRIDQSACVSQNSTEVQYPSPSTLNDDNSSVSFSMDGKQNVDNISLLCLDPNAGLDAKISVSKADYEALLNDPSQVKTFVGNQALQYARRRRPCPDYVINAVAVPEPEDAKPKAVQPPTTKLSAFKSFFRRSRPKRTPTPAPKPEYSFANPNICIDRPYVTVETYACSTQEAMEFDPDSIYDLEKGLNQVFTKEVTEIPTCAISSYMKDTKFLVSDFKDPADDPKNWSFGFKVLQTILYGLTTLVSQFNSAVVGPILPDIQTHFGIEFKVAVLGTSLYIIGISFGPILFAPLSEMFGRKLATLPAFFLAAIMTVGAAYASTCHSFLMFRFLAGLCSAAPIVIGGGMLSDIWAPAVRGNFLSVYSNFVTLGPCLSPIVSCFILQYNITCNWRTVLAFPAFLYFVMFIINTWFIKESYRPVLLQRLAAKTRHTTGNRLYHSNSDKEPVTGHTFLTKHVKRPLKMMTTPIVFTVALYAAFVFGVFYLVATTVTATFTEHRGFEGVQAGSPMMAVYLGAVCLGIPINLCFGYRYQRLVKRNGGKAMPEERMYPLLFFSGLMPLGMALFGLTVGQPAVHWIVPCLGLSFMGAGFFVIFQGCLNYLVDAFPLYSASAIAVSTCLRSLMAGGFPLWSKDFFGYTGVEAGYLYLALISALFMPVPFVLYAIGRKHRKQVVME